MTREVTLYGKKGCHLCEATREDLRLLEVVLNCVVQEIDITSDPELFERYRYLIPVVDVQGSDLLYAPITLQQLREALS